MGGFNISIRVVAALIVNEGKVLLCRRAPGQRLAGYWEFPGGKVEGAETDEESLERELLEELRIKTKVTNQIAENTHQYEDFSITLVLYLTKIVDGTIQHTVHDKCEWIYPVNISSRNLAPADLPFINAILSKELQ